MTWSAAETERIVNIEEQVNLLQEKTDQLASKKQLNELMVLLQSSLETLQTTVNSIQSQLTVLTNRVNNL